MISEQRIVYKEGVLSFGGGGKDRFPSFATAARTEIFAQFPDAQHVFTARQPRDNFLDHPDVYPQGLTFKLSDAEKNRDAIRTLGNWLRDQGIDHLHSVLYAPAGAAGKDQTFLKLRSGSLDTHTPDGEVTPEYGDFLAAANYTTGEATRAIIQELTAIEGATGGEQLFDHETQLAMIGFNPRGYRPDGSEDPVGDPVLTRLYAPMDSGKLAGKQVATEMHAAGYTGVTAFDTIPILTRSSDIFPVFEAIVLSHLFVHMYHNADTHKNPFWKELFDYFDTHYPDFRELGQACHDLLYGQELVAMWQDAQIPYGEKCNTVVRAIHENFGNKLAEIRQIAYLFSQRADTAFGTRLAQALAKHEFRGQPSVYLGYEQLANTEIAPTTDSSATSYHLYPPVRYGSAEFLSRPQTHRADGYGLTYALADGSYSVPLQTFIDTEHMGILPGVISLAKALNVNNVDICPNTQYTVGFEEMVRSGQRISIHASGVGDIAVLNETTGKNAVTIKYAHVAENPTLSLKDGKAAVDLTTMSYVNEDGTLVSLHDLELKGQTQHVDEEGVRGFIPHRGSFQFARQVNTALVTESSTTKKFLAESIIRVDRDGGLELLVDAFAQAGVTAILTRYNLTLFRGFTVHFTEHAFREDGSQIDIRGIDFKVKTFTKLRPSMGSAKSEGVIEDEHGNVIAHIEADALGQ